ncbi:MAG: Ig domain-containing protein [Actinomycetaceae bacterium]|nr:Ig domain-containing protein [Actinomycetaceae bacterium]
MELFESENTEAIDTEIIRVADKTAPVIIAPTEITVSVGAPVADGNEITAEDAVEGSVIPTVQIGHSGSGLTYDEATGKLTGKGGKPGDYVITVTAKGSKGNTVVKQIPLSVRPDTQNPTIDDVLGLSEGKIVGKTGQEIAPVTIKASDDSGKVVMSVKKGTALPKGLVFNPTTGVIIGKPQQIGTGSFTIVATDPSGNKTEQEIAYVITDGVKPTVKNPGALDAFVGEEVTLPIEAKDDNEKVTCKATGLAKGLSIDPKTCTISGTPTEETAGNSVVTVTDEAGNTTSVTVAYNVIDKKKDTDGDGVPDAQKVSNNTNPVNPNLPGDVGRPQ